MHSFRARITALMIVAILVYGVLVGGLVLLSIRRVGASTSERTMDLICETNYEQMEEYLDGVENSVSQISHYITDEVDVTEMARAGIIGADGSGFSVADRDMDSDEQKRMDGVLTDAVNKIDLIAHDIAIYTNGVSSYYFKLNPELSDKVDGFWYEKINSYTFEKRDNIDVTSYSSDDIEHVGWYYLPQDRGRPSWVGPYVSSNLDEMVISYIEPLYKAGTFIGIVGMDISYPTLEAHINELQVLQSGYAFLTDENGVVIYHPELPAGAMISNINPELDAVRNEASNISTIEYENLGVKKRATWRTLSNGIRLFVTAPVREINGAWQNISLMILIVTPLVMLLFAVGIRRLMRRMTRPIEDLAGAAGQISEGKYDLELDYEGDDEIGVLTKSFIEMAGQIKLFVQDLNSKAYTDSPTGVRNKSAYDVFCRQMDETIQAGKGSENGGFAVAMFDCNELKETNDHYGHDKGDIYLQTACSLICKVFSHSPVFRVGGDEFISVLRNEDLRNREQLLKLFDERARSINNFAKNEWDKVSLAIGIADYDPELDSSVEDTARRADELMYRHKNLMKGMAEEKSQ